MGRVSVPGLADSSEAGLPKNVREMLDFTTFSFKEKMKAQGLVPGHTETTNETGLE